MSSVKAASLLSKNGFNHGITSFVLFIQIEIGIGIAIGIKKLFFRLPSPRPGLTRI